MLEVNYSEAREHLSELWDRAVNDRETIRLTRRGKGSVVLVSAAEYDGLLETAHLLRSPANAARLCAALDRALRNEGEPRAFAELRADFERAEEA
jgi:antitoxin YefM